MNRVENKGGRGSGGILPLCLFLFFISGFSALLYQVAWQRILAVFTGVEVYSVTIIVAAFMGGLGFGSMAGGAVADSVGRRRALLLFALSEAAIGLFALASKWLFYDFLYLEHPLLATRPALMTAVLFASLLIPTFFMGMTLPLLSRALTGSLEGAARTIGALYGLNTLGSAVGAFVTGWVLLRLIGFESSLYAGAAMNFIAAAGALFVAIVARAGAVSQVDGADGGAR